MKLLLIEDDIHLSALVKTQLSQAGYALDAVTNGEEGIYQASELEYDCIVLDINLPDMTGFDVCKQLRSSQITTPILMLTARNALEDRVEGLNLGADDYVSKPVDSLELIARVKALIRRNQKNPLPVINVADLVIDQSAHAVKRDGQTIELNSKEFAVLEYLALHYDEVVTRTMIMEHVWGSDFETLSNVVDVYIRYLRKKIDLPGMAPLIHTVRGYGYSLGNK
jgi:DNA-binding response OmpR family regulator